MNGELDGPAGGRTAPRSGGAAEAAVDDLSEDRLARVALTRVVEPGDVTVGRLVAAVGALRAYEQVRRGRGAFARFGPRVQALDVDRDLDIALRLGARIVVPGDVEWPDRLDDLPVPPWCLWVRGPARLGEVAERSVAVVGSRDSTAYGESVAAEISAALASRGWAVVSGGAYGIDASAHRGALAVDGTTVAVSAAGIDRIYPAGHRSLVDRILDTGGLVTEAPPGWAPMKSRFLARNRLIAAMTCGTIVVEAGARSGSLNTAGTATKLGRPVGAVPGPVTSMSSTGCHEAIRQGQAVLVTSGDEVLDLVGRLGEDACEPVRGEVRPTDDLGLPDATVHEALPIRGWMELDRLVLLTTLPPLAVRAALARLEERGLARCEEGRWRKPGAR